MPLAKGKGRQAFSQNVETEMSGGKPQKQALAIAYSEAGLSKPRRADGGAVTDAGGPGPAPDSGPSSANLDYPRDFSKDPARVRDYVYGTGQLYKQLGSDIYSQATNDNTPSKAFGGSASSENWLAHNALRGMQQNHAGPINSAVAGRTDHIPMNVASGSYVIPADIVSGLGQGNTAAGHQVVNKLFHSGPYGDSVGGAGRAARPNIPRLNLTARPPKMGFAHGGSVPIMAAGGEHVLTPEQVAGLGGGDIDHGHEILDAWIKHERAKINKEQKKLPGPARD